MAHRHWDNFGEIPFHPPDCAKHEGCGCHKGPYYECGYHKDPHYKCGYHQDPHDRFGYHQDPHDRFEYTRNPHEYRKAEYLKSDHHKSEFKTIFEACKHGTVDDVRSAIRNGATVNDVNERDKKKVPLHYASAFGNLEVVHYLLDRVKLNTTDDEWRTPLCHAVFNGHPLVAVELLKRGADVNLDNKDQMTPLHAASTHSGSKGADLVETLLRFHAEVDAIDFMDRTPLHNACLYSSVKVVRILLAAKADVNAKDVDLNQPLYFAAKGGKADICEVLLQHGADTSNKNKNGLKAKDVAKPSAVDIVTAYEMSLREKKPSSSHKRLNFTWKRMKSIGAGAFGEVDLIKADDGKEMALKVIDIQGLCDETKKRMMVETNILKIMHHPNIVTFIKSEITSNSLLIFMEYMPKGSLKHIIHEEGPFEESACLDVTRQIVLGLEYLHKRKVIHRDVKGDNILMDYNNNAKLADLGVSKFQDIQMTKGVGTLYYMAPEVIKTDDYGPKADIWSLGCTIIEMLNGQPTWVNSQYQNYNDLLAAIMNCDYEPFYSLPHNASIKVQQVLENCFTDPEHRWSATRLKHFFNSFTNTC